MDKRIGYFILTSSFVCVVIIIAGQGKLGQLVTVATLLLTVIPIVVGLLQVSPGLLNGLTSVLNFKSLPFLLQRRGLLSLAIICLIFSLSLNGILLYKQLGTNTVKMQPSPTVAIHPTATHLTTLASSTASVGVPTPTSPSTSPVLYEADFSQGSQGWITGSTSSQWKYNDTDKVIEGDGSLPCCAYGTTLSQIELVAPYALQDTDYMIEAKIRATSIPYPYSHDYNNATQPFFGFYLRGAKMNQKGYMMGLNYNPGGDNKVHTFLVTLDNNPVYQDGGVYSNLDQKWYIYQVKVQKNTFRLYVDGTPVTATMVDNSNLFPDGPQVGLEEYDYALQVQYFKIYKLQ